jgi:hypothetical protein
LWPSQCGTWGWTRRKLITSLIVSQFLYGDIIFCKSSMRLRERLKLALNSSTRYIYSIYRFRHISHFADKILEVPLYAYYIVFGCAVQSSDWSGVVATFIYLICFSLVSQAAYSILSRLFIGRFPGLRRFLFWVQFCGTVLHRLSGEMWG